MSTPLNHPDSSVPMRVRWLPPMLMVLSLGFMFYPGLIKHMEFGTSLRFFQDDMLQQIIPYLRYSDPGSFDPYYAGDYFMACMPLGFHILFRTVSTFMDPITFAVHLPYVLYALFLAGMARAAYRLGGWSCCWLTLAFCLCADTYLDRMSGGLARAFGYPIIGLGLAALVTGRMVLLMAVIVGGALFYPSAAVPLGMALAILLMVAPSRWRGDAVSWSLKRRILLLGATGGLSAMLILPTALRIGPYGPSITPGDVAAFPESGPDGRYQEAERAPFPGFVHSAKSFAPAFMFTQERFSWEREQGVTGKPFVAPLREWAFERNYKGELKRKNRFLPVLYVLALIGGLGLVFRSACRQGAWLRLLLLPICAATAYQIARVAAPYFYLPERYVVYPVPPFMALFIAAGLCGLPLWLGKRYLRWQGAAAALLIGGLFLFTFGGRGNDRAGLYRRVMNEDKPLYEQIAQLPNRPVIAGWPNKAINYMALHARQTPYLTFEIHQAFHQAYALEMRDRMNAFMKAYYATDQETVRAFHETQGVDILILDQRDFSRRPNYFLPFGEEVSRLFKTQAKESWAFWKTQGDAIIGRTGPYVLVDLKAM